MADQYQQAMDALAKSPWLCIDCDKARFGDDCVICKVTESTSLHRLASHNSEHSVSNLVEGCPACQASRRLSDAANDLAHEWSAAQIGALMIAATQAIDFAASMCSSEPDDNVWLADNIRRWRAAVAREQG